MRYWAAKGRPGTDTAFDTAQMKVGRRLAMKILNASRFALSFGPSDGEITEPIDLALVANLATLVERATASFEAYDYTSALESTEEFFWSFCDDYLELVKARAYGEDSTGSARATLTLAVSTLLRLFAPFLPFVTEEVWSWWQDGSVHRAPWPTADQLRKPGGDPAVLAAASTAIGAVRKAKSDQRLSMRQPVTRLTVTAPAAYLANLAPALDDLRAAGTIAQVVTETGVGEPSFGVVVDTVDLGGAGGAAPCPGSGGGPPV